MSVQRANEFAVAAVGLQFAGTDPQLALFVSEGPMCPNEKPVTSETKGRGSDPRRHGASGQARKGEDLIRVERYQPQPTA